MGNILDLMLPGFIVVSVMMTLLWVYQMCTRNAGVVDLGWALGLVIMCGGYLILAPGFVPRKVMIFALVLIWGCRLSWLLINRFIHEQEEDRRYRRIRKEWGDNINLKFFLLFQFEAALDALLSIPFLIICMNTSPQITWIELAGVALFFIGLTGEAVADHQLKAFKAENKSRGKICQKGLWNYSRHPNYFFEWIIWVSYFVIALGSPYGPWAMISPVIMLVLLIKVTGIPMMEQHALKTKGAAFKEYRRTTSFFVPMPKRA